MASVRPIWKVGPLPPRICTLAFSSYGRVYWGLDMLHIINIYQPGGVTPYTSFRLQSDILDNIEIFSGLLGYYHTGYFRSYRYVASFLLSFCDWNIHPVIVVMPVRSICN